MLNNGIMPWKETTKMDQRYQFALEALISGEEEHPEGAPSRVGLELLYLKTVIDCLDEAL